MKRANFLPFFLGLLAWACISCVTAEDPYRFFNWVVTYGQISPLGVPQRVCKLFAIYFSSFGTSNDTNTLKV